MRPASFKPKFVYIPRNLVRSRDLTDGALSLYAVFLCLAHTAYSSPTKTTAETEDKYVNMQICKPPNLNLIMGTSRPSVWTWSNELIAKGFLMSHGTKYFIRESDTKKQIIDSKDYAKIPLTRWHDPSFKPHHRKLYMVLCSYIFNPIGECWPSRNTLASNCNVQAQAISANLKHLQDLGLVIIKHRRRMVNNYHVVGYKSVKHTIHQEPLICSANQTPSVKHTRPKYKKRILKEDTTHLDGGSLAAEGSSPHAKRDQQRLNVSLIHQYPGFRINFLVRLVKLCYKHRVENYETLPFSLYDSQALQEALMKIGIPEADVTFEKFLGQQLQPIQPAKRKSKTA